MSLRRANQFAWLVIFVSAVLVRLPALGPRSFWIDEMITRNTALLPLWRSGAFTAQEPASHSILSFCMNDSGPGPLMYMLEGSFAQWARLYGGEFWLRIPGIIAGLLVVFAIAKNGRLMCGGRVGAVAMGSLAAVLPELVDWSTSARGYAWGMLIAAVQFALVTRLARRGGRDTTPECRDDMRGPESRAQQKRKASSRDLFAMLCLVSIIGLFIHQVQLIWTVLMLGVVVVLQCSARECDAKGVTRSRTALGIGLVLLVHGLWLRIWTAGLSQRQNKVVRGLTMQEISQKVDDIVRQLSSQWFIAGIFLITIIGGVTLMRRRHLPLALRLLPWGVVVACLALYSLLVLRLFPAPRYFFGMTVAALWLCGVMVQAMWNSVAGKMHVVARRACIVGLPIVLFVILAGQAIWAAHTPVHDWANTAMWIKQREKSTDVILCGPNADIEVFTLYANEAKLESPVLRLAKNIRGEVFDANTEPGLRMLLETKRRLWLVTPFFGQHRTPKYWQTVRENFRLVATIPGKGGVQVYLHQP